MSSPCNPRRERPWPNWLTSCQVGLNTLSVFIPHFPATFLGDANHPTAFPLRADEVIE
jgi:hypothetical protein